LGFDAEKFEITTSEERVRALSTRALLSFQGVALSESCYGVSCWIFWRTPGMLPASTGCSATKESSASSIRTGSPDSGVGATATPGWRTKRWRALWGRTFCFTR